MTGEQLLTLYFVLSLIVGAPAFAVLFRLVITRSSDGRINWHPYQHRDERTHPPKGEDVKLILWVRRPSGEAYLIGTYVEAAQSKGNVLSFTVAWAILKEPGGPTPAGMIDAGDI